MLHAVTPESLEVKKLVHSALGFLEKNTDERLGGKCLIALTFLKAGRGDHARIREAVEECRRQVAANPPDVELDVYSDGLAVIFLCELAPDKHSREIAWYLDRMRARQMNHGGWGYANVETGTHRRRNTPRCPIGKPIGAGSTSAARRWKTSPSG